MAFAKATIMFMLIFTLMCMKARSDKHGGDIKMRKKEVSVYYHDTLNVTSVMVVQAPSRPGAITSSEAPFGTLFFANDPVTEGPDPASARLGNITGSAFASSLEYGSDFMNFLVLTFFNNSSSPSSNAHPLQGLHGTLTVSGISSMSNPQPQPITGGTGSFAFVLGSLTMVPIDISTFTQVLRLDLVLYWPPYSPTSL